MPKTKENPKIILECYFLNTGTIASTFKAKN